MTRLILIEEAQVRSNDFYGGPFANFNLEAIETWKKRNQELCGGSVETNIRKDEKETASGDEICISLPRVKPQAFNLTSSFHVRERTAEEEEVSQKARIPIKPFLPFCPAKVDEAVKIEDDDNECSQDDQSQASTKIEEKPEDNENTSETTKPTSQNLSHEQGSNSEENKEMEGGMNSSEASDELSAVPEPEKCDKGDEEGMTGKQIIQEEKKKEWTAGDIRDEWRRFCFDLSPRVMYCCGDIIELLIKSDVARYCEFRTVSRVLTLLKDKLEP
ncbi:Rab proteins geranylgeranyltransferase component a 1, partial [Plakobranchus ocellatus]